MARLVLTDASPLVGLARIDGIPWLAEIFGTVAVTEEVLAELTSGGRAEPGIVSGLDGGWLYEWKAAESDSAAVEDEENAPSRCPSHLGIGEWSVLCAARQHRGSSLLLMDDRLARRQAVSEGFLVTGTAAVIGMARSRGLIGSAKEAFARLLGSDFRIFPKVIRTVLERVEEA